LYWQTAAIPTPPFVPVGPAFYPRIILGLLAILALWLILEAGITSPRRARVTESAPAPRLNYRLVVICFAVFGGYVIGLSILGYLLATFCFVLGLGWVLGPREVRGLAKLAVVAAGTTLGTYLLFERYLYVFLPRGILF
jgi:hypothetical protein